MTEALNTDTWLDNSDEKWREYIFADGTYRVDLPQKVMIHRKPEGDSHRIVAKAEDGSPVSHYVRAGWMAIRWVGIDGTEAFGW